MLAKLEHPGMGPLQVEMPFTASTKTFIFLELPNPVEFKVISETGMIVREQKLRPPFENAMPFEFRLGANKFLVGYKPAANVAKEIAPAPVYTIFDSESAEPLISYQFGESIRGALGCFTGDRFTFLTGTRDGHFAILEAAAK